MLALWQVVRLWSYHNTQYYYTHAQEQKAKKVYNIKIGVRECIAISSSVAAYMNEEWKEKKKNCMIMFVLAVVCTKQTRRIIFLYQQKIIVRLYRSFYYIQQFFEHLYDDKSKFFPKRKIALIWIPLHLSRFHLQPAVGVRMGQIELPERESKHGDSYKYS